MSRIGVFNFCVITARAPTSETQSAMGVDDTFMG